MNKLPDEAKLHEGERSTLSAKEDDADRSRYSALSPSEFLALLEQRGVELSSKEGRLKVNAAHGVLGDDLRHELMGRKSELISLLISNGAASERIPLHPRKRTGKIPQTPAQQGLWVYERLHPSSVAYCLPQALLLDRVLTPTALQRAVHQLTRRHDALRTYFYEEDGELLQAVSPGVSALVGVTDLSKLSVNEARSAASVGVRNEARKPFDLGKAPLFRVHLFQLPEARSILFFQIHHIISDIQSLALIREELFRLYEASEAGEDAKMPRPSASYADYAIWMTKRLDSALLQSQLQYWIQELTPLPQPLMLGVLKPGTKERSRAGVMLPVQTDAALRQDVVSMGLRQGASPFITFLTAFAVVLHNLSGLQDFCIGFPSTHRKEPETERTVGMFVNMLPLRCRPKPDMTLTEFLSQVRSSALEAYENSDVPFQQILRFVNPERSARSPIFQVIFSLDPYEFTQEHGQPLDTEPGTARYDLSLQMFDNGTMVGGFLEYAQELFSAEDAERLIANYKTVLSHFAAKPHVRLSEIEVKPPARDEVESLLEEELFEELPMRHTPSDEWAGGVRRRLFSRLGRISGWSAS